MVKVYWNAELCRATCMHIYICIIISQNQHSTYGLSTLTEKSEMRWGIVITRKEKRRQYEDQIYYID